MFQKLLHNSGWECDMCGAFNFHVTDPLCYGRKCIAARENGGTKRPEVLIDFPAEETPTNDRKSSRNT